MRKNLLLLLLLLLFANILPAQKKYAILFGSEHKPDSETPLFYTGTKSIDQQEAIWNDTYLMWELLLNKGFSNDDMIVLYHTGEDYVRTPAGVYLHQRYDPQDEHSDLFPDLNDHLTKMASTQSNLQNAINTIKNKNLNPEDLVVLFVYSHGSENRFHCNNYDSGNPATYVTANELRSWLATVNCKKLILMQQCKSGSFIDELEGPNTIVMTSTNDSCLAAVADQKYFYYNPVTGSFDYSTPYSASDEFELYAGTHEHVHSEWFLHMYMALNGAMPDGNTNYETTYANFPISESDLNSDNYITFNEAHQRTDEYNSQQNIVNLGPWGWVGDDPQLSDQGYLGKITSLEYPTMLSSDVDFSATLHGEVPVFRSMHIRAGNTLTLGPVSTLRMHNNVQITIDAGANLVIDNNVEFLEGGNNDIINYGTISITGNNVELPFNITVKSGGRLDIEYDNLFRLVDNGTITVESGGTMTIGDNCTITGPGTSNIMTINGNLQVGTDVNFSSSTSNKFGGLVLNNNNLVLNLNNCEFYNAKLTGNCQTLNITNNSSFSNSVMDFTKGNLNIQSSTFSNTQIRATSPLTSSDVQINNCEVKLYPYSAIYINGYKEFSITNCHIHDNGYNGIYVYNAGSNSGLIKDNTIENNGSNNHAGIRLYNSYADIELNYIAGNRYGVMCFNGSNTSLEGFQLANYPEETQRIENNEVNQVYSSSLSFPDFFRYNSLLNQNSNYKVFYDGIPASKLDVTLNFWGRSIYPQEDLYPDASSYYNYLPPWFYTLPSIRISAAEKLYTEGIDDKEKENFENAQKKFQKVIEKYSESSFAIHSLKELLAVEELSKENYKDLKEYMLTEKNIQQNKLLKKLAHRIANTCDIKLKNYPTAIAWFENVIENPETLEDSVFAIIDLAYTYILMEEEKSSYTGMFTEYKFENEAKFEQKREELIDLLFEKEEKINTLENNSLSKKENANENPSKFIRDFDVKVFPNPFREETTITYSLKEPSEVSLKLYDNSGKEIAAVVDEYKESGNHQTVFNLNNFSPGIYFYKLIINGQFEISDKLLKID